MQSGRYLGAHRLRGDLERKRCRDLAAVVISLTGTRTIVTNVNIWLTEIPVVMRIETVHAKRNDFSGL